MALMTLLFIRVGLRIKRGHQIVVALEILGRELANRTLVERAQFGIPAIFEQEACELRVEELPKFEAIMQSTISPPPVAGRARGVLLPVLLG